VDYMYEMLCKKYKRVTTAQMMDASGVPREDWEGEMISELPRRMQEHAQKLADEARRERDAKNDAEKKLEQKLDAYLRTIRCIN